MPSKQRASDAARVQRSAYPKIQFQTELLVASPPPSAADARELVRRDRRKPIVLGDAIKLLRGVLAVFSVLPRRLIGRLSFRRRPPPSTELVERAGPSAAGSWTPLAWNMW